MAEQDLKTICDAIPAEYNSDISTQAHNILNALTGLDISFDIHTGGDNPSPFDPVVSGGVNTITFARNSQNGGFDITSVGSIEGVTVNSPVSITQNEDNKDLVITTSGSNFKTKITTIKLHYMQPSGSQFSVVINNPSNAENISNHAGWIGWYCLNCKGYSNDPDSTFADWNHSDSYRIVWLWRVDAEHNLHIPTAIPNCIIEYSPFNNNSTVQFYYGCTDATSVIPTTFDPSYIKYMGSSSGQIRSYGTVRITDTNLRPAISINLDGVSVKTTQSFDRESSYGSGSNYGYIYYRYTNPSSILAWPSGVSTGDQFHLTCDVNCWLT